MSYDEWPTNTMENRRDRIKKTIRPVSIAELKALGEKSFPVVTDPWCVRYNELLTNNPTAKFYQAEIPEGAQIVYCRDVEAAVWFLPGQGMGIVQDRGLEVLKEVVDAL